MPVSDLNLANWRGTVKLNAGPGSSSTANSIIATANITTVNPSKSAEGDAEITLNFESDGAVRLNGVTSGTASDLKGWGGSVTLPSGFNVTLNAWSASITQGTTTYSVFDSRWQKSKQTTGIMTGSASGVLQAKAFAPKV